VATQNSIYCPACQAKTNISITVTDPHTGPIQWQIGECNDCAQHFLIARHRANQTIISVWPKALAQKVDVSIPEAIRNDLEEAHRSMTVEAFRGAATLARRAMQSVALDKGAPKTKDVSKKSGGTRKVKVDLIEQIDWLESNRIIVDGARKLVGFGG
jgi:hypothetical protein